MPDFITTLKTKSEFLLHCIFLTICLLLCNYWIFFLRILLSFPFNGHLNLITSWSSASFSWLLYFWSISFLTWIYNFIHDFKYFFLVLLPSGTSMISYFLLISISFDSLYHFILKSMALYFIQWIFQAIHCLLFIFAFRSLKYQFLNAIIYFLTFLFHSIL